MEAKETELEQVNKQNEYLKDAMQSLMTKVEEQREVFTYQQEQDSALMIKHVTNFDLMYKVQFQTFEHQVI